MSDIYKRCNNLGLTPESIASYLTNLIQFSKTVPLSQISEYIQQKADEKKKLEEQIQNPEGGKIKYRASPYLCFK
jgi:hypothetical protein